ncbi:MAG: class I SAM-dependent methyltransferase [Candidatus Cyclobacteriaceae bacterium M3_2C_046]
MFFTIENCPICNHSQFTNHLICKDYLVSHESFSIVNCENCQFKFTNPRPTDKKLDNYYQSDQYISHSNKSQDIISFLYKLIRNYTISKKLKLIKSLKPGFRSLLDVGCGTGDFLNYCQNKGLKVQGVEPNETARNQTIAKNIVVYKEIYGIDNSIKYDIITLWHVLEHLPDLNKNLTTLAEKLEDNGLLFIAVPNYESYDSKYYREYWAAYDVPRHLYHFNKSNMAQLLNKHYLKIISVFPMKFDAFYVSMLSEKYKNQTDNLFKAFMIGLKSNIKSKKGNNYSSLIYVAQK